MLDPEKHKPAQLKLLLERQFDDINALIEPALLIPGSTMLIGGPTKIGKTMITLDIARALNTQTSLFSCPDFFVRNKKRVLIVEQEVGERELSKRATKVFDGVGHEELDGLWYASKTPDLTLETMLGRDILGALIDQAEPDVIIIDPISRIHNYEENSNTDIGRLFNTLDMYKQKNPALCFVILHHFSKPPTGITARDFDPLDIHNFRGSSKFVSVPDTIVCCQKKKSESYREYLEDGSHFDWWRLRVRIEIRHGNKIDDFVLTVNKDNDLRVMFERWVEPRPMKTTPNIPKTDIQNPPIQLDLGINL